MQADPTTEAAVRTVLDRLAAVHITFTLEQRDGEWRMVDARDSLAHAGIGG